MLMLDRTLEPRLTLDSIRDPQAVQVVAVDLDNTLLTPAKQVGDRTAAAVASLRALGVGVIPVTARGLWNLRALLPRAPFGPYAVCGNGAVVVSLPGEALVELTPLALPAAERIIRHMREAVLDVSFAAETLESLAGESWIMEGSLSDPHAQSVRDVRSFLQEPLMKLMCAAPGSSPAELHVIAANVVRSDAVVTYSEGAWIEICAPGVEKGSALARACRRLSVERANVVCVGDQINDISMMEWAGTAVAVSNAAPAVIDRADIVIPSNADEGVAQMMEGLAQMKQNHSPPTRRYKPA
jgi:Cof subfamily protein (haloacid dehalogenase superfamily)